MMDNSDSAHSSKKRLREVIEEAENEQNEKQAKFESSGDGIEGVLTKTIINGYEEHSQKEESKITKKEIEGRFYKNEGRQSYLDIIWKLEMSKKKFEESFVKTESFVGRDNIEYQVGLANVPYKGSLSSSLIFSFQNGDGLTDEEFRGDLVKMCANMTEESEDSQMKDSFATKTEQEEEKEKEQQEADNVTLSGSNKSNDSQQTISTQKSNDDRKQNIYTKLQNTKGNYNNHPPSNDINGPTFDFSLTVNVVNHSLMTTNYDDVQLSQIILNETQLNTLFFNSVDEDIVLVIELTGKKNYNQNVGFTGIVNEAMTCYMNSMLQTLNTIGYFKNAVFNIPFENQSSVAYSLQRLFYDLMTEAEPISTNKLISSFGWSRDEIFIQHDVQEFFLLLSDLMEKKMKGTPSEGAFKFLFEGKTLNYIKCLDVEFNSNKEESMYDIQLTVKGCKDIYESLNKYTEEELLDGDDKYHAEGHGKQRAKKGIKFLSIPPVVIFQLKRFEYNPRRDQMDKINDSFHYYEEIDLKPYLPADEDGVYTLLSVVVHKGSINNGHYYAFIKPDEIDDKWYLFNDETVREADKHEVFNNHYGGVIKLYRHKDRGVIGEINPKSDGSAYILVYVKKSMRNLILKDVVLNDIPKEIIGMIEKEKKEEAEIENKRIRQIKYMDVFLLSQDSFLEHSGLGVSPPWMDLIQGEILPKDEKFSFTVNVPKKLKIKELMHFISSKTNINVANLVLFTFSLNHPRKIEERNSFRMHNINESYFEVEISNLLADLDEDAKYQLDDLYIFIGVKKSANDSIFEPNSSPMDGEEIFSLSVEDGTNVNIYIPCSNKYEFVSQMEIETNETITNSNEDEWSNNKLFFIKMFKFENYIGLFQVERMLLIEQCDDIEQILSTYMKQIDLKAYLPEDKDISAGAEYEWIYFLEKTSGDMIDEESEEEERIFLYEPEVAETISTNSTAKYEHITQINFDLLYKQTKPTDSFVIIPCPVLKSVTPATSYPEIINNALGNLINEVHIPILYQNCSFLFKGAFNLQENHETFTKRLFSYLSKDQIWQLLQENEIKSVFVVTQSKEFIPLEIYSRNNITHRNIIIQSPNTRRSDGEKLMQSFIFRNKGRPHINFEIRTIDPELEENTFHFPCVLNDEDNNPKCKLLIHLPNQVDALKDILDYIQDDIIKYFYDDNMFLKGNFYFFLQHPYLMFSYDLLIKLDKEAIYNIPNPIEYRIQPYNNLDELNKKIFVAFQFRDGTPACEPIVLFVREDTTVLEAKNMLLEKMTKIKKLSQNPTIDLSLKNVKIYKYKLINYQTYKDTLLLNSKDEEVLLALFKNETPNVLVEFIPVNSDTSLNNGNQLMMNQ